MKKLYYKLNLFKKVVFTISTKVRYAVTKIIRIIKYPGGGITNPKGLVSGVNGSITPKIAKEMQVKNNHLLGLLRKNGVRAVRMTKTIRISVAIDSINQPV